MMRIPLLFPSRIAISRLNIDGTWGEQPSPATTGYDPDLREPYAYETSTNSREDTRQYQAQIRIPCQVEVKTFEQLQQVFGGNTAVSKIVFVLHNRDLTRLGLLNGDTLGIKVNDRIDSIEDARGRSALALQAPLYIFRIDPGSWGAGPSGTDLKIVWTTDR